MRNVLMLGATALILFAFAVPAAEAANPFGSFFTTGSFANMYKWFRDFDGDGIPNGQDPDWVPPLDGTGYQAEHQNGSLSGDPDPAGNTNQSQYRYTIKEKKYQLESGDLLRLRLRDGSCDGK
jgi:hypothetical protein